MVFTVYPNAIDGAGEILVVIDKVTKIDAQVVNRYRDAIIAVETELGTNPKGSYATVKDRLDAIESGAATVIAGDVIGTLSASIVKKINGSVGNNNETILSDGNIIFFGQISDGYISSSANITGSKISSSTTGALGVIQLARDLGGTATLPTVIGFQGRDISSSAPSDGYTWVWNALGNIWTPQFLTSSSLVPNKRTATTTPITITANDEIVRINLSSAGPSTVNLPASPLDGQTVIIKDAKGDAFANHITINVNGAQTINGVDSVIITENYNSLTLVYDSVANVWDLI